MTDSADDLRAALQEAFPQLVRNPVYLGAGDFSVAFTDGNQVIRVPRNDAAAHSLQREACLLPSLAAALPLPVPSPRFLEWPADGRQGIAIHTRIDGAVLTRAAWEALPPRQQRGLALEVARFLRALHAHDISQAIACGIPRTDHRASARAARTQLGHRMPALPGAARAALHDFLESYVAREAQWHYEPALLHGDLAPEHVLYDSARSNLTGIIDFGDLAIGDPARDFIYVYEDYGSALLALVLDAYGEPESRRFRRRVLALYLIEQVLWLLAAESTSSPDDVAASVPQLLRTLEELSGG